MPAVGRNDPCPCGSGTKYKKCCLPKNQLVPTDDFSYRRYRQIESDLIPKLMRCAAETWGECALYEAWDEFHLWDCEEEYSPESEVNQVFMPYFLFFWSPDPTETDCTLKNHEDKTVPEILIHELNQELSTEEVEILESANRRPLFLYEILSTKPNDSYRIRNLFTDEEFEVIERIGSSSVEVGSIILSAIFYINGQWQNIATAPYPLRPIEKQATFQLRDEIRKRVRRKILNEEILAAFIDDIRALYLDLIDSLLNPTQPVLRNTDGDMIAPQILHFEVNSPQGAFDVLGSLTMKVMSQEDLLREAAFENGKLRQVEIPWFKKDKYASEKSGYTLLGRLTIDGNTLTVEVNSNRRANRIRKKIQQLLGNNVRYKTTVIDSIERRLNEHRPTTLLEDKIQKQSIPAEIQKRMKDVASAHWEKWIDDEIPALNGLTPRQAAKTKDGVDLLKSLLHYYEQRDRDHVGNLFKPDVNALRSRLGIK